MDGGLFVKFATTMLSRIGMILIHISTIPSLNVNLITFQHILNLSLSTFCYLLFGYRMSRAQDLTDTAEGWILNNCTCLLDIIFGWRSTILAEGLMSIILAGRAHLIANTTAIVVMSTIVQPIITNIITTGTNLNAIGRRAFEFDDINRMTVLHILPGSFAFAASVAFGKRAITIKDIDINSLAANAHSFSLLGYTIIIFGYVMDKNVLNVLFSMPTAILTAVCISLFGKNRLDYWVCVWMLQSGLAAVIGTSVEMKPYEAAYMAIFTVTIYSFSMKLIRKLEVEDNCNIIAIHGIIGSIILTVSPLNHKENGSLYKAGANFLLAMFVFSIGTFTGLICLFPLKCISLLRSNDEFKLYRKSRELPVDKEKLKRRDIQPGSHTQMKLKKYIGSTYLARLENNNANV